MKRKGIQLKSENLKQLNEVIVQPLRQKLLNNDHVEVFLNYDKDNWELCAAATSLKNPDLTSNEVLNSLDRLLHTILSNGQTPCNSSFLALAYGYTYLFQRINAIERSFRILEYLSEQVKNNCLFVDVGCGIGGLLIALRNLHENEDFILNYRGYDIVEEVLPINQNFLSNIYPDNVVKIDGDCIESIGAVQKTDIDTVIMIFSYIFSQNGINEEALNSFKDKVDALFDELNLKEFYILYININPSHYNSNYNGFIEILKKNGYEVTWQRTESEALNNSRLTKLSNLKENLSSLQGSNVHCTVSEIKRV